MSPQEGGAFIARSFESAYDEGDVGRFLRLFASDAVSNRGGIDAIRDDYSRLFHNSRSRTLHLDRLAWIYRDDRIVGTGDFDARIVNVDRSFEVRGWIRIEAVPVGGLWKIQRLQHGNRE